MHLDVDSITLRRGERTLISSLSFAIAAGEALVLKGPNGVGKTTLMRAVAGFIRPASGHITLRGGVDELSVAEQSHFVSHQNAVKAALTVRENAAFWCRFQANGGDSGDEDQADPERADAALARLGLGAIADIRAQYLSAGQRRRLALARLLLCKRALWLLDEPTVSLDAEATRVLADVIAGHLAVGGLVLAATHIDLGLTGARELQLERLQPAMEATWDHS